VTLQTCHLDGKVQSRRRVLVTEKGRGMYQTLVLGVAVVSGDYGHVRQLLVNSSALWRNTQKQS